MLRLAARVPCRSGPVTSTLGVTMTDEVPLQSLRIPRGWNVAANTWTEADSDHPDFLAHFGPDLLQLVHTGCNLLVDVGWYGGPDGTFGAVVHRGDFHGPELASFRSRDRLEVVSVVEGWLVDAYRLSKVEGIIR